MRCREYVAILLAGLVCAGCSSIWVDTDYDIAARCTTCVSFGWQDPTSSASIQPEMLVQVREIISEQLESMGISHVDDRPDMLIAIDAGLDLDTLVYRQDNIIDGDRVSWAHTNKRVAQKGTLVLSAFNGQTGRIFWRGTAASVLEEGITAEGKLKLVRDAVPKMFKDFPPSL
jgi:hypothetical protein